jgi:hypothetical protein
MNIAACYRQLCFLSVFVIKKLQHACDRVRILHWSEEKRDFGRENGILYARDSFQNPVRIDHVFP